MPQSPRCLPFAGALVLLCLALAAGNLGATPQLQTHLLQDYLAPEILDRPLGIEPLPNGNILITDAGGAFYTLTDDAITEVDRAGQVVWQYVGEMVFPHSAERLSDGTTLVSDTANNRVFRVDSSGQIVWTSDDWGDGSGTLSDGTRLQYPNDAELLVGGHLLITDRNNNRVIEVSEEGEIIWQYSQLNRPHNADRLENGNTLVCNSEEDRVVEISPAGQVVWTFGDAFPLDWPRDADRLSDGNTLITDSRNGRVLEVTPQGQVVWSFSGLSIPYEADRLASGNTLIADNNHRRVIEVNPAGEVVWQFHNFPDALPATLQNGDFEQDLDGDDLPDGWYPAAMNAEGPVTFLWDPWNVQQGEHSATLLYLGEGRASWLQVVEVVPGRSYRFAGYLRAELRRGLAAYQLWFLDEMGGPIGEPITVEPVLQGVTDWRKASAEVAAPENASAVQIWCQIIASDGQAGFDQIRWEERTVSLGPILAGGGSAALLVVGLAGWFLLRMRGRRHAERGD